MRKEYSFSIKNVIRVKLAVWALKQRPFLGVSRVKMIFHVCVEGERRSYSVVWPVARRRMIMIQLAHIGFSRTKGQEQESTLGAASSLRPSAFVLTGSRAKFEKKIHRPYTDLYCTYCPILRTCFLALTNRDTGARISTSLVSISTPRSY